MNRAVFVYVCIAILIELAKIEGSTYLVKEGRKSRRLKRYIKHACTGNTKLQGTIESTNVNLTWKRIITANDSNPKVALHCYSCRVPNGNNAEFLINNRSADSLTYNKATGKCTHRHGECSPDVCQCSSDENDFIRYYPLKDISPMTDFSCDMRFVDASKSMKFSKLSTVYFDGQEFHYKYTVTHMTTPLDDNLDGNTGYKEALLWVGIILATILVVTVLIVFGFYHRKRNKKKKKCDNEKRSSLDEKRCDNDKGSCLDEKICDNDKGTTLVGSCQLKRNIKVPSAANLSSLTGSQITLEATVTVEERHNNNGSIFVKGTRRLNACENQPLLTHSERKQKPAESAVTVWTRRLNACENQPLLTHSERKQKPAESAVTVYNYVQKYTKDSRHIELSEEIHPESHAVIGDIETVSCLETKKIKNDWNSAQVASALPHAPQSCKSFDVLFLNFETQAEDDWVVNATEVLENQCNLRCGCAQFGDDSFKYTGETTTIIMTFSEKSSKRKPAILSVIDYIQSVVVVLVEQCSIPVQRRHMKCVDATKGEKIWRNQLLTALGFKAQEDLYCNSITTRSTETK